MQDIVRTRALSSKKHGILPLNDLVKYSALKFMHKFVHSQLPFSFNETWITNRARIFKHLWSPGIDFKECIPPAHVAWRAGMITLFLLGS
jgi:hypothetical protein